MGESIKILISGLFLAASLLTGAASGQTSQQPSPAGGSIHDSVEQKAPDKSATGQNKPSQPDAATPESRGGGATQSSANSNQESAAQSKDAAQSGGNDENDEKDETAHHRSHIHLGTIGFGVSYTRFPAGFFPHYGYGLYPFGAYGPFYSPFAYGFYDPFYGPYFPGIYGGSLVYGADKGEVKLSTSGKGAQVYLDGAFAGPADKLKSMWLDPGAYNLSVSGPGEQKFEQRIYVISGKTLKIRAQLRRNRQD